METQVGGLPVSRRGHRDDPLGCLPVYAADQSSVDYRRLAVRPLSSIGFNSNSRRNSQSAAN
jgi:hypothetical protein